MPFHAYQTKIAADGTGTILVQQDNASVEWDIYQISLVGPNPATNPVTAKLTFNDFFICSTPQAAADTATGPPSLVLSRSDTLTITYSGGTLNDVMTVGIWYRENPAGTTNPT